MVKIRLARQGRKKLPIYRIIASDSRARRDGRYVEALGQYRPLNETGKVELKEDRVMYWLGVGAQPSTTVRSLLSKEGILLKWHLQKKQIPAERAEEIFTKWKTERDEKASKQVSEKERAAAMKKKAADDKKAAEAKAKADAHAAEAKAAADAKAAEEAANAPAEESASEAPVAEAA